jgi:HEAT repeat protein
LAERDFDTFHAVLSTGFTIQDHWTRDFALSLIPSQNPSARRTALSFLAWLWRDELSFTTQQVDGLVEQIMASPPSDSGNRERAMLLGMSGDRRAIQALLYLLNDSAEDCAGRDIRIAALHALGQLHAVDTRELCLSIASADHDLGTRFAAVQALLELGFDDAAVEAAAKAHIRRMVLEFGTYPEGDEPPTLKRWIKEATASMPE